MISSVLRATLGRRRSTPERSTDAPAGAQPLTIQMVLPAMVIGGMETMVLALARHLIERGHRVGVTCLRTEGPLAAAVRDAGIPLAVVPAPGAKANLIAAPGLREHFRRVRPDVVHAHSGAWGQSARAAHAARVPAFVHTAHGLDDAEPWHLPIWRRIAAWQTDHVVCVSAPLVEYHHGVAGVPRARLSVIANGIDTDRFTPRAAEGRGHRVGVVARLVAGKNHARLLRAFCRVRGRIPDATLTIVGDGPLREALGELSRTLGVHDAVTFAGERTDMPTVYRQLDVCALSSDAEGTSMTLLEAMASGLPIVATAVGGTPALLDRGACGWLVPLDGQGRDEVAFADALFTALTDDAAAATRAANARRRVVERYGEGAMTVAYEHLYHQVLMERQRRVPMNGRRRGARNV